MQSKTAAAPAKCKCIYKVTLHRFLHRSHMILVHKLTSCMILFLPYIYARSNSCLPYRMKTPQKLRGNVSSIAISRLLNVGIVEYPGFRVSALESRRSGATVDLVRVYRITFSSPRAHADEIIVAVPEDVKLRRGRSLNVSFAETNYVSPS